MQKGRLAHHQMGEAASSQTTQDPVGHGKELGFYFKGDQELSQGFKKGRI